MSTAQISVCPDTLHSSISRLHHILSSFAEHAYHSELALKISFSHHLWIVFYASTAISMDSFGTLSINDFFAPHIIFCGSSER